MIAAEKIKQQNGPRRKSWSVFVTYLLPPTFLPLFLPPSVFSFVERDRNGPTSLGRGEGHLCVNGRGWERARAATAKVGEGIERQHQPLIAVDDGFKLRSHA